MADIKQEIISVYKAEKDDYVREIDAIINKNRELQSAEKSQADASQQNTQKLTTDTEKRQKAVEGQISDLKQLEQASKKAFQAPDITKSLTQIQSLRAEVRKAADSAVQLGRQFGFGSAEALKARDNAAKLRNELLTTQKAIAALDPQAKFTAITQLGSSLSGIFQVATGALQAFGAESERATKLAQQFQGALNIAFGLNQITQLGDAFKNLKSVLGITDASLQVTKEATGGIGQTFQTVRDGITETAETTTGAAHATELYKKAADAMKTANVGMAASQVAVTGATEEATVATQSFTKALLTNPIFLTVAAITALVTAYLALSDSQEKSNKLTAEEVEKNNKKIESLRAIQFEIDQLQLKIDQLNGTKSQLEVDLNLNKLKFENDLKKLNDERALAVTKAQEEIDKLGRPKAETETVAVDTAAQKKSLDELLNEKRSFAKADAEQDKILLKQQEANAAENAKAVARKVKEERDFDAEEKALREKLAKENQLSREQENDRVNKDLEQDRQRQLDALAVLAEDARKAGEDAKAAQAKLDGDQLEALQQTEAQKLRVRQEAFEREKQIALDRQINEEKTKGANAGITGFQGIGATTVAIEGDQQAIIEFNNFVKSATDQTNADIKAARIKTEQDILKVIKDLNEKNLKEDLQATLASIDQSAAIRKAKATETALSAINGGGNAIEIKTKLDQQNAQTEIDIERTKNEEILKSEASTDQEKINAMNAVINLRAKAAQDEIDIEADKQKQIQELVKQSSDLAVQLATDFASFATGSSQQRQSQLEAEKEAQQESFDQQEVALQDDFDKKLISARNFEKDQSQLKKQRVEDEKKINAAIKEEQRKQAVITKEIAVFEATLNFSKALLVALSAAPPPFNAVLEAITAALAGVHLAAVIATPIPKFKKGTKRKNTSGLAIVGEEGEELVNLPAGAGVLSHTKVKKNREVIDAMFEDDLQGFINRRYIFPALAEQKRRFEEHSQKTTAENMMSSIKLHSDAMNQYEFRRQVEMGIPISNIKQLASAFAKALSQDASPYH